MPFGPTGPTGGKNGRPSSFHAPIVGSQGAFSCTFHPEYARNRTPGRGAGLHESGGGSGDALDQARQAFLAIMERQDQAVPKSFADFSASLSRNHEIDADLGGGRTPRVMTVDLLDEMLKYGKGQSRLGTAASRRKKAASASKSRRAATPDAPIIMQVPATPFSLPDQCRMSTLARRQPDAAEPAQRMVVDSPPQTAASAKTVRAWRAPTGLAAEQRRCAHLTGRPHHAHHHQCCCLHTPPVPCFLAMRPGPAEWTDGLTASLWPVNCPLNWIAQSATCQPSRTLLSWSHGEVIRTTLPPTARAGAMWGKSFARRVSVGIRDSRARQTKLESARLAASTDARHHSSDPRHACSLLQDI